MNERFYLLKIQLLEIEPDIWRRFVVPGDITLERLHDVIQIVMGWTDSHLHEFTIGKKRYTEYPEYPDDGKPCSRYRLVDLIKQKGRSFMYEYDFGDSWRHKVTIEDSRFINADHRELVYCLEGERACPPEDVGGPVGYSDFCNVLKDPDHPDFEMFNTWSGENFDPEQFDHHEVNDELLKYLRWSRDREKRWLRDLWVN